MLCQQSQHRSCRACLTCTATSTRCPPPPCCTIKCISIRGRTLTVALQWRAAQHCELRACPGLPCWHLPCSHRHPFASGAQRHQACKRPHGSEWPRQDRRLWDQRIRRQHPGSGELILARTAAHDLSTSGRRSSLPCCCKETAIVSYLLLSLQACLCSVTRSRGR